MKEPEPNTFSPFDYPEVRDLLNVLLDTMFNESGRGAILIAATRIEEHLTNLIESILPANMSKKGKDRLFAYPGQLSSFSAKINLSYAFRIIDKTLYDSLNTLRTVRNDAAHSASQFSLHELNDRMRGVYNFGPSMPDSIKRRAYDAMIGLKMSTLNDLFNEHELSEEERKQQIEQIFNNPKTIISLEKQLPYYELLNGLCFICGLLYHQKEKISRLTKISPTWGVLADLVKGSEHE
jgi:hypothetical protein